MTVTLSRRKHTVTNARRPVRSERSAARHQPMPVVAVTGAASGIGPVVTARLASSPNVKKVIAIDNSEKMVEFGAELARKHGIGNMEYRLGELEDVPIRTGTVDLAFLSQALHHARDRHRQIAGHHAAVAEAGGQPWAGA